MGFTATKILPALVAIVALTAFGCSGEQTPGDIDRHFQYVWGDRCSSEIGDCPELMVPN